MLKTIAFNCLNVKPSFYFHFFFSCYVLDPPKRYSPFTRTCNRCGIAVGLQEENWALGYNTSICETLDKIRFPLCFVLACLRGALCWSSVSLIQQKHPLISLVCVGGILSAYRAPPDQLNHLFQKTSSTRFDDKKNYNL